MIAERATSPLVTCTKVLFVERSKNKMQLIDQDLEDKIKLPGGQGEWKQER